MRRAGLALKQLMDDEPGKPAGPRHTGAPRTSKPRGKWLSTTIKDTMTSISMNEDLYDSEDELPPPSAFSTRVRRRLASDGSAQHHFRRFLCFALTASCILPSPLMVLAPALAHHSLHLKLHHSCVEPALVINECWCSASQREQHMCAGARSPVPFDLACLPQYTYYIMHICGFVAFPGFRCNLVSNSRIARSHCVIA